MDASEARIRVVVVSPGDVARERTTVKTVIDELNRLIAQDRLVLWRWETDARPGLHLLGPQGLIDDLMDIQSADVVIGVFWKRFGTPTGDALSGTAHELRHAWASWKTTGRPEVLVYFSTRKYAPREAEELPQWQQVLEFKRDLPKEQLWWQYATGREFEALLREHLTRYVLDRQKHERGQREHAEQLEAVARAERERAQRKRAEQQAAVDQAEREHAKQQKATERAERESAQREHAEQQEAIERAELERAEHHAAAEEAERRRAQREDAEQASAAGLEQAERQEALKHTAQEQAEREHPVRARARGMADGDSTAPAAGNRSRATSSGPPAPHQRSADQKRSRRGKPLLFLSLTLVAGLAAGAFFALPPRDQQTTPPDRASRTTRTTPNETPRVVLQGSMRPPAGSSSRGSAETAVVNYEKAKVFKLLLAGKGLKPVPQGAAYALWLYSSPAEALFIGFPKATVNKNGTLEAAADLTPETPSYREVLLTRERAESPTEPGTIVLRGKISVPPQPSATTP